MCPATGNETDGANGEISWVLVAIYFLAFGCNRSAGSESDLSKFPNIRAACDEPLLTSLAPSPPGGALGSCGAAVAAEVLAPIDLPGARAADRGRWRRGRPSPPNIIGLVRGSVSVRRR